MNTEPKPSVPPQPESSVEQKAEAHRWVKASEIPKNSDLVYIRYGKDRNGDFMYKDVAYYEDLCWKSANNDLPLIGLFVRDLEWLDESAAALTSSRGAGEGEALSQDAAAYLKAVADKFGVAVDFSNKEYDGDKQPPLDFYGFIDFLARRGEGEAPKSNCTLSNQELLAKVEWWVHKLAESGGRAWTLRVPVDFNYDPDMLIIELANRFRATLP